MATSVTAETVTFNPSPDERVVGYILYWNLDGGDWNPIDMGAELSVDLQNIVPGRYQFRATGYDANGVESRPSEILEYEKPGAPIGASEYPPVVIDIPGPEGMRIENAK
jgi:hypothetical protein